MQSLFTYTHRELKDEEIGKRGAFLAFDSGEGRGVEPIPFTAIKSCAGIFKQSIGARNRKNSVVIPARQATQPLEELVPWNRFLRSLNV